MQLSNAVRQRIVNLAKSNNVSLKEISERSDIKYVTLISFMVGKTEMFNLDTLNSLCCNGFNLSVEDFFSDSLFDDVISEENTDVVK